MHDRKRTAVSDVDETKMQAITAKLQKAELMCQKAMALRKEKVYTDEAFELTTKVLEVYPEFYTMWNYRREIWNHLTADLSSEEMDNKYSEELAFSQRCLQRDVKSYCIWHHRKIIIKNVPSAWAKDLKLCDALLNADERNFHCWSYRRSILELAQIDRDRDLEFTMSKINQNFSNYSAWHQRSKLLASIQSDPSTTQEKMLDIYQQELELVQQAFFTEPDDQSAWIYHRWLLQTFPPALRILDHSTLSSTTKEDSSVLSTAVVCFSEPVKITSSSDSISWRILLDPSRVSKTGISAFSSAWECTVSSPSSDKKISITLPIESIEVPTGRKLQSPNLFEIHISSPSPSSSIEVISVSSSLEDAVSSILTSSSSSFSLSSSSKDMFITFSNRISSESVSQFQVVGAEGAIDGAWVLPSVPTRFASYALKNDGSLSRIWVFRPSTPISSSPVSISSANSSPVTVQLSSAPAAAASSSSSITSSNSSLFSIFEKELNICDSLLELEPESKWAFLSKAYTLLQLYRCSHNTEEGVSNGADALSILERLESLDSWHADYYLDMKSTILWQFIEAEYSVLSACFGVESVSLSSSKLSILCHPAAFPSCPVIDLSKCAMSGRAQESIAALQSTPSFVTRFRLPAI